MVAADVDPLAVLERGWLLRPWGLFWERAADLVGAQVLPTPYLFSEPRPEFGGHLGIEVVCVMSKD